MRGGGLRDRVTVERQASGTDDYGNPMQAWSTLGTYWGDVRIATGKERIASGAVEATALATIRLRNSTEARAILASDRMVTRDHTWNITTEPVVMGRRREFIEFTCETGVAT